MKNVIIDASSISGGDLQRLTAIREMLLYHRPEAGVVTLESESPYISNALTAMGYSSQVATIKDVCATLNTSNDDPLVIVSDNPLLHCVGKDNVHPFSVKDKAFVNKGDRRVAVTAAALVGECGTTSIISPKAVPTALTFDDVVFGHQNVGMSIGVFSENELLKNIIVSNLNVLKENKKQIDGYINDEGVGLTMAVREKVTSDSVFNYYLKNNLPKSWIPESHLVEAFSRLELLSSNVKISKETEPRNIVSEVLSSKPDVIGIHVNAKSGVVGVCINEGVATVMQPSDETVQSMRSLLSQKNSRIAVNDHAAFYDYCIANKLNLFPVDANDQMAFLMDSRKPNFSVQDIAKDVCGVSLKPENEFVQAGEGAWVAMKANIAYTKQLSPVDATYHKTIERPLLPVLASMRRVGIKVDQDVLEGHLREQTKVFDDCVRELKGLNVNAPKEVRSYLESIGTKLTGKGTSAEVLESVPKGATGYAEANLILQARQSSKVVATLNAMADVALVDEQTGERRVHATFDPIKAVTGRISTKNPPLQGASSLVKDCLVPSSGKRVFVKLDYSQQEIRILAVLAKEESLIQAIESGLDVHTATAAAMFEVDYNSVSKEQRKGAKAINFGLIYGITKYGLAKDLGITTFQAQANIDTYFKKYPKLKSYLNGCVTLAKESGYAVTLNGRKNFISDLASTNTYAAEKASRKAKNHPMQGTGAEIVKNAMNITARGLVKVSPSSDLVLTVHDELVFECNVEDAVIVRDYAQSVMQGLGKDLGVALNVDAKIVRSLNGVDVTNEVTATLDKDNDMEATETLGASKVVEFKP